VVVDSTPHRAQPFPFPGNTGANALTSAKSASALAIAADVEPEDHRLKLRGRDLAAAFALGMSGLAFTSLSLWARFADYITSPLRVLQWIGLLAAGWLGALIVAVRRRAPLWPIAASTMLGGLVFGTGGPLGGYIGTAGALVLLAAIVVVLVLLLNRLDSTLIRALVFGLSLYLVAEPIVQFASSYEDMGQTDLSTGNAIELGAHPLGSDLFVIVLDGYNSILTMKSDFPDNADDIDVFLRTRGFNVSEAAWAPATRSVVSIASLLDARSLAVDREPNPSDLRVMYEVIQGEGRLFKAFAEAGYTATYIESGWLGSVCGQDVDYCVRRPFADEAVQELLASSMVASWWESTAGHAFSKGALNSLAEIKAMMSELTHNNRPDLVFSHVLLPHGPYSVDERCQVTGEVVADPPPGSEISLDNTEPAEIGYLQHVRCVDSHIKAIAEQIGPDTAMVIVGDHGSTLRGQMFDPPTTWSHDQVRERGTVFVAAKYPRGCGGADDARSSLAAVQGMIECLLDSDMGLDRDDKVWLYAFEGPPRCVTTTEENDVVDIAC